MMHLFDTRALFVEITDATEASDAASSSVTCTTSATDAIDAAIDTTPVVLVTRTANADCMISLLDLPVDAIWSILDRLDAPDLARFAATAHNSSTLAEETLMRREAVMAGSGCIIRQVHRPPRNMVSWAPYLARLHSRRRDAWRPVAAGTFSSFFVANGGKLLSGGRECRNGTHGHGIGLRDVHVHVPVKSLEGIRIVNVSHGDAFCAAVSSRGTVYTWGLGAKGQLGHGDEESRYYPEQVHGLGAYRVLTVTTGHAHCVAVAESGDVFSWGFDRFGQCGHGKPVGNRLLPLCVESLSRVTARSASAGGIHSLVVMECGSLYSFGDGARGQLGHGSVAPEFLPRVVVELLCVRVKSAASGYSHSVALAVDGAVFEWGKIIWWDDAVASSCIPKRVRGLCMKNGIRVCGVVAGHSSSCAITTSGELFTWGTGPELGHGKASAQLSPKRVVSLQNEIVVAVSVAVRHTLVVTHTGVVFGWGDLEARGSPPAVAFDGSDPLFSPCLYNGVTCMSD